MKLKSKTHGYLDYIVGVLLIAAPWILGFYRGGAESWVPIALGAGVIFYSLLTNYEMGAIRAIPFKAHLALDIMGGIFLAMSPWIFNFSDYVSTPHVVVGIMEIIAATFTKHRTTIESDDSVARRYNVTTGRNPTLSH